MVFLPRQARDKHRKNSPKKTVFPQSSEKKGAEPLCTSRPCLYDMAVDQQEQHDLSAKEPAILKQLEEVR